MPLTYKLLRTDIYCPLYTCAGCGATDTSAIIEAERNGANLSIAYHRVIPGGAEIPDQALVSTVLTLPDGWERMPPDNKGYINEHCYCPRCAGIVNNHRAHALARALEEIKILTNVEKLDELKRAK